MMLGCCYRTIPPLKQKWSYSCQACSPGLKLTPTPVLGETSGNGEVIQGRWDFVRPQCLEGVWMADQARALLLCSKLLRRWVQRLCWALLGTWTKQTQGHESRSSGAKSVLSVLVTGLVYLLVLATSCKQLNRLSHYNAKDSYTYSNWNLSQQAVQKCLQRELAYLSQFRSWRRFCISIMQHWLNAGFSEIKLSFHGWVFQIQILLLTHTYVNTTWKRCEGISEARWYLWRTDIFSLEPNAAGRRE